jgi:hypothetical protein
MQIVDFSSRKIFGGGQHAFERPELRQIFEQIIADTSRRFFFLVDGFDEYDGDPKEIISLVLECAAPWSMRVCSGQTIQRDLSGQT